MASHQDILLSANILIKKYGTEAEEHAAKQMWEFRNKGDMEAANGWKDIIQAIKEMRTIIKSHTS